jgi:hypothetical protein
MLHRRDVHDGQVLLILGVKAARPAPGGKPTDVGMPRVDSTIELPRGSALDEARRPRRNRVPSTYLGPRIVCR